VDGKAVQGNLIIPFRDGKKHQINVQVGPVV